MHAWAYRCVIMTMSAYVHRIWNSIRPTTSKENIVKNFVSLLFLLFQHGRNPYKNTQSICFFFHTQQHRAKLFEERLCSSILLIRVTGATHTQTKPNGYLCLPSHVTQATVRIVTSACIPHIHHPQFSLMLSQMLRNSGSRDHTL